MSVTEDDRMEMTEKGTLEGLCEEIGKHGGGRAVCDVNVTAFGMVSNEKIPNVDVAGTLATGGTAVAFHFDCAFVVLVKECGFNWVALCCHKVVNV